MAKLYGSVWRVKFEDMAKYLARSCPRCAGYLGIIMRKPARNFTASDQWALSGVRLSTCLGTRARQKVGPAGCHTSSFITLDSRCCGLAGKAARNAPKRHSSRLRNTGVFVSVVAHPIQDMSAV